MLMEIIKKITLAGDGLVGKTSLIRRYVLDHFDDKYTVTIGTKVTKKNIKMNRNGEDTDITFMIWDIMGQMGFSELLKKKHFEGAAGAIGVADITRKETLDDLTYWTDSLYETVGKIPVIILANKCDVGKQQIKFTEREIADFAKKYKATYGFTSAKTGVNVGPAFRLLTEAIVRA